MSALARLLPAFELEQAPPKTLAAVFQSRKPDAACELKANADRQGYERGLAEGRAEKEVALAEAATLAEERLAAARAAWVEDEAGALVAAFDGAFAGMLQTLSEAAAGVLLPLAGRLIADRAARELCQAVEELFAQEVETLIQVCGPVDILESVRARLGERAAAVEFEPSDGVDARLLAGDTVMETQLEGWKMRLSKALSEAKDV
ncbi:hypothetical protein [Afifella sp. IM 167]|uniref:hypothetical protein n=1 Tax=Afifella sp. IM 167 TaxID=2033586 RepID=UPI001CCEF123|nr:hypothetical protein [Afifella sp. IM 167]MBZ8131773.1 hypothetical protein [Afifella sp. IM 167]